MGYAERQTLESKRKNYTFPELLYHISGRVCRRSMVIEGFERVRMEGRSHRKVYADRRQDLASHMVGCRLCGWCLTSSSCWSCGFVASLLEVATRSVTGEAGTLATAALLSTASSPASSSSTAGVILASEATGSSWSWSSLFNIDLLCSDSVRVIVDGGLVGSGVGELNKGALLSTVSKGLRTGNNILLLVVTHHSI